MIAAVELRAAGTRLRPPEVADAPAVLLLAQDPDVRMWNPRCSIPDLPAAVADCVTGADWSDGAQATFSIIDDATAAYAGTIALHHIDHDNAQARIGYRIAPWTRGRGVATGSVRAVSQWAFTTLRLHRIVLTHAVGNTASCHVAHKAGFALEGVMRASKRFGDGLLHDEHLHARLAADPG
ncbi:GNAT family N-acetyltransferase [Catellatospora citrea]|uniref:Acetyltransferase n=1 Tax=Catellatospora citrea TaxID=53366 RepID=A0A8J3NZZ1_9ACTN|nr:GNAT family protein [Catellatospora citrea]RKE12188.1 RimJ/RimL family protein N-acetyltransferase [Catellatospora citrea]GIF98848.1 acetyltransferase [Catellatospora citrea]